jgi:hypothetical protein
MSKVVLKRQFIADSAGKPVGVILPLERFAVVEEILEQRFPVINAVKNSRGCGRRLMIPAFWPICTKPCRHIQRQTRTGLGRIGRSRALPGNSLGRLFPA